jgi:hypothetical protein
MEAILHILGLCPDSLSHFSLIELMNKFPIIDILNLFKNGR